MYNMNKKNRYVIYYCASLVSLFHHFDKLTIKGVCKSSLIPLFQIRSFEIPTFLHLLFMYSLKINNMKYHVIKQ